MVRKISVTFTMSAFSNRFVVFFYNVSGIHCIKFEDDHFQISKFLVVSNIVKMFVLFSTVILVLKDFNLFSDLYQIKALSNYGISNFSLVLAVVSNLSFLVSTVFIGFIQTLKSNKVLQFLNTCNQICKENIFNNKLEKLIKRNCLLNLIFYLLLASFTISQRTDLKLIFFSIVFILVFSLPQLILFGFLSFLKNFETFFLFLLKNLTSEMKNTLADSGLVEELIVKYQSIYRLNNDFNEIFGRQITILTCYLEIAVTIQVRKITAVIINSNHFYFSVISDFKALLDSWK